MTSLARHGNSSSAFGLLIRWAGSARFMSAMVVTAWLALWQVRSTGSLSFHAFLGVVGFVAGCMSYGSLFERFGGRFIPNRVGAAYQLLTGFFAFNTLLFILTLSTPFGIRVDSLIVLAAAAVAHLVPFTKKPSQSTEAVDERPGLICVVVGGAAATLWAADLQPVALVQGNAVVFRAWSDIFIHVREISAFAQAHGFASMSDIKMYGAPPPAYHFGSYVSAAAFSAWTSTSALASFGGFQLPFGILLMGVASFVLIGTVWSPWPALAAVIAVVAFPDAYQQGFVAGYLGFHFMSQVNLGMLYGVACVSIAWMFVIEGCRRPDYGSVLAGYLFFLLTLGYKAHVFVANAYLVLVFPCLFLSGLRWRWRVGALLGLTAIFVGVVALSQTNPRIPTLRLDGSGAASYMRILYLGSDEGPIKRIVDWVFFQHTLGPAVDGTVATLVLLFGSFGVWTIVGPIAFWKLRDRLPRYVLALTGLVVLNYLVMSLGLALDERGIGTPEELLNRPMAWSYFVLVSFAAAAVYVLVSGTGPPVRRRGVMLVGAFGLAACAGVATHSSGAQTFPPLAIYRNYADFNEVPLCAVRAAEYLRLHSNQHDVVQDSGNDPDFVMTALSERQDFISASAFAGKLPGQDERLRTIELLSIRADVDALEAFARTEHISWYLVHPSESARWPASFLERAAYECDGYRVIRLTP